MKLSATITLIAIIASILPIKANDSSRPEGWATCSSVTSADDYDLTGGNGGSLIVLRNDGTDMRGTILNAVLTHDVIVFDGVNGDFVLPSQIDFQSLEGRTFIGVNGARLRTQFTITQEIRDLLDELDVRSLSQRAEDNLGGTLSNGSYVAEQRELTIRQALIDRYGDSKEKYRYSGVFNFNGCSNIIIRNLDFAGPGSIDVGGADLVTLNGCDHIWVDHCRFTDGMDGNLDIVNNSDFVTVSDTHFSYTDLSYIHSLSNLTSGTEITDGSPQKCNISWIRCYWDEGCEGRMPYTVLGIQHILNSYWDCPSGTCIDAHNLSKLLIEKSYFSGKVKRPLALRDDNVKYDWRGTIWYGNSVPKSNADINVPYSYTAGEASTVPALIKKNVGPTLADPYTKELSSTPAALDFGKVYANNQVESFFNLSAFGSEAPSHITLTAPDGILLSAAADGEYSSSLVVEATDKNLIQIDVYVRSCFTGSGNVNLSIEAVASDGQTISIPVTADVVGLDGEPADTYLLWPLDNGASSATEAVTSQPDRFSSSSFGLGDKIYIRSSQKIGGSQVFTLFNPTEALGKVADEDCYIVFDVVTAPGYIFVPKTLTLNAARIGTDMCYIDIECGRDYATPRKLLSGFQPVRSSESPYYSVVELPLVNAGVGESLRIKVYLYNMLENKQLALSNVRIDGQTYVADGSSIESILSDERAEPVQYYDLLGRRVARPRSGNLYLMRVSTGPARLILYR